MKRLFLLILFCISTLGMSAQKFSPAIIHTKDGKEIECLVKFPKINHKKISYKLSQNSKAEKIPSESIKSIAFIDETGESYREIVYTSYYNLVNLFGKIRKAHWLGVVIKGEVSLYMFSVIENGMQTHYCLCKRDKEDIPTAVGVYYSGAIIGIGNPFYKKAAEYFSDYPELAKKISNKEYKPNEIETVVMEYNVWKSVK